MNKYDPNAVYLQRKQGNEQFIMNNKDMGFNLMSFWSYQYSNIWSQTGEMAEFLVAKALEGKDTYTRNHEYWAVWDLNYRKLRIEIKASADFHSWNINEKKKTIRVFDIHKVYDWGYITEEPETKGTMRRMSQIYVFCHNKCPMDSYEPETCDPLNLDNWDFYILPTSTLDKCCGNQKTISLGRLKRIHGRIPYRFDEIKDAVDAIYNEIDGTFTKT